MDIMRVEAGSGWGWMVEGWQLFVKAPGIWVIIMLIYLAISIAISLIPVIGGLVYPLISPVLAGGMFYGAARLAAGQGLEVSDLFQGFRERTNDLLLIGLFSIAGAVIMVLIVLVLMGGSVLTGAALSGDGAGMSDAAAGGMVAVVGLLALLLVLSVAFIVTMAMFYSVPLVMLGGQKTWPAITASLTACWVNVLPLLIFGLVYVVLGMLAAMTFGLGFLVLGPLTVCAIYASYREVFGDSKPYLAT